VSLTLWNYGHCPFNGIKNRGIIVKAYEIGDFGKTGRLRLVDRPVPAPKAGEVLVRVRATGLNARDLSIMRGNQFGSVIPPTHIPLSDIAGDVVERGDGVTEVAPGDRVTMTHYWRWLDGDWNESMREEDYAMTLDGFLVEQAVVPAAALIKLPDSISYEEASTLQSAGLTAWNAVVENGRARAGETVVTLGTGGVSVYAMQWARMKGARVIVTSSSDAKLARMRELGADGGINYAKDPAWSKGVMQLTDGRGAELVINNVGIAELDQCLEASASGGRIMHVGANPVSPGRKAVKPEVPKRMGLMIMRDLTIKGIIVGSREMFVRLIDQMAAHEIKPVIDRVYDFGEVNEAIDYMAGAEKIGKVVIRVQ
jgi:NADPH:quinone reductase-like Zn-dependent oxidoreductase